MSLNEDERSPRERTKVQRACDACRRKKIKCRFAEPQDDKCSGCATFGIDCTYIEAAKKRGFSTSYVNSLQAKVEKMEKIIRQLCPDDTFYNAIINSLNVDTSQMDSYSSFSNPNEEKANDAETSRIPQPLAVVASAIRGPTSDPLPEDEEENSGFALSEQMKALNIEPVGSRYFGKSSGALLVLRTFQAKEEYLGPDPQSALSYFRPRFWTLHEWERKPLLTQPASPFEFPADDLLFELISLYFERVNIHLPLLHRLLFERSVTGRLHHRNTSFALVVLLVCAIGSRFSPDPRTRLDAKEPHSSGWKWFNQAISVNKTFFSSHTLYDLQFYPLAVQFVVSSTVPQLCWSLIGIGLRVAMDIGAHRRGISKPPSAEEELRKRAFWILLVQDGIHSSAIGRPCGVHDEDFDLDLPINCDDEYWETEDPNKRFVQPTGKPSNIAAFIAMIKLNRILSFTLRTIYATNKSKVLFDFAGSNRDQTLITELDSALNSWIDALPVHLRWDPNEQDDIFHLQSTSLYAQYYLTQITIHRPFIPSPSKPSSVSSPSLSICTGAARSCSHLLHSHRQGKAIPASILHEPILMTTLILLLNIWSSKSSPETSKKDMEIVQRCMKALKAQEDEFAPSGRIWDVLRSLSNSGGFSPLQGSSQAYGKRFQANKQADGARFAKPSDVPASVNKALSSSTAVSREMGKGNDATSSHTGHTQTENLDHDMEHSESSFPPFSTTRSLADSFGAPIYASSSETLRRKLDLSSFDHTPLSQPNRSSISPWSSMDYNVTPTEHVRTQGHPSVMQHSSSRSAFTIDSAAMASAMFNMDDTCEHRPSFGVQSNHGLHSNGFYPTTSQDPNNNMFDWNDFSPNPLPTLNGDFNMNGDPLTMDVPSTMLFQDFAQYLSRTNE